MFWTKKLVSRGYKVHELLPLLSNIGYPEGIKLDWTNAVRLIMMGSIEGDALPI